MSVTKPTIDSTLVWREAEDGVVIIDPNKGTVRALNGVGSDIWKLAATGKTIQDIADQIVIEYEVDATVALNDATLFLTGLEEEGLLTLT